MVNEAGVEEQSHKHEMRAALRGDFERLRARREGRGETAPQQSVAAEVALSTHTEAQRPRSSWLDRLRERR